jgi:hypothetical protein
MKHWLKIFFWFTFFGFSQTKETFPLFTNCQTEKQTVQEKCFYNSIQNHFKTNFDSQLAKQKFTAITLFSVDSLGEFKTIYIDAASTDIKQEIERVFNLLPKIKPATYNNNPIFSKYTLKLQFPLIETLVTETVKKLTEFEAIKYQDFKNPQFKSGGNIPFTHLKYTEFDAEINAVGNNNHTAVKPYAYNEVAKYYDFEKNHNKLLLNKTSWWGKKFWNENILEIQGDGYWFFFNPIADLRLGKDNASDKYTYVNTRGINVQGGIGKNITFFTSIYESQGRFDNYYNQLAISLKPGGGNPATIPGVGIAKEFDNQAFDFPLAEANLKFTANKFFDAQIGYGRNFIGDGYRSILQGDGTSPYPFLKLNTTFWKIKYTNTYMYLRDVTDLNTVDNTYATKYMANHYLSWNISNRFNMGFFESVVWSNTNGRGFDANFINPIIFYRAVEFASSPKTGNALLGLTGKFRVNNQITTYGQFLIDEFSVADVSKGNSSWKNKFGYQIGAKYFNAFNIANLFLQLEYNIVRPYVYSHSAIITNYAHNNQSMGHNWGANFRELIAIARYNKHRYFAQAKLIYGQKGFDYNDGINTKNYGSNLFISYLNNRPLDEGVKVGQGNLTNIFIADLTGGYIINPSSNLKIYGNLILRNFNPATPTIGLPKENTAWFNIGITSDLFNWYFDY